MLGCPGKTGREKPAGTGSYLLFAGVGTDVIAVMEEGEISAKGEGFSAEMGNKSPKGRASPICPSPSGWLPTRKAPQPITEVSGHPCTLQSPALAVGQGGNRGWELRDKARGGCSGHISPVSHLLWPQALLHPLVLDAGDLVEQAVAVELQALVELAVRQPLPGEEGEARVSPQGTVRGSPRLRPEWGSRGLLRARGGALTP